jgi:hypothetical protein
MYHDPDLSQYSANSGNAINGKLQQLLKIFTHIPGADTIVAQEVAAMGRTKKTTPTKAVSTLVPATPKAKKRKVIKEEEEEEISEED